VLSNCGQDIPENLKNKSCFSLRQSIAIEVGKNTKEFE
jgi:hypothetical protein